MGKKTDESIRVAVRLRPLSAQERQDGVKSIVEVRDKGVVLLTSPECARHSWLSCFGWGRCGASLRAERLPRRSILLIRGPAKKRKLWVARSLASRARGECSHVYLSFISPYQGSNVVKTALL